MTWKGRVSGVYFFRRISRASRNSRMLPGQPWDRSRGTASAFFENNATKWTLKSLPSYSMLVVQFGKELMRSSVLRLRSLISFVEPVFLDQ